MRKRRGKKYRRDRGDGVRDIGKVKSNTINYMDVTLHDPSIHVECIVNPSEDISKVIKAVRNVIDAEVNSDALSSKIIVDTHGLSALEVIKMQIHARQVMNTFKRIMLSNMSKDCKSTWLYLNKQAAYAGIASICENEDDSPLGPITITITDQKGAIPIIEWLTADHS